VFVKAPDLDTVLHERLGAYADVILVRILEGVNVRHRFEPLCCFAADWSRCAFGRAYYSFECFDSLPPTGNLN